MQRFALGFLLGAAVATAVAAAMWPEMPDAAPTTVVAVETSERAESAPRRRVRYAPDRVATNTPKLAPASSGSGGAAEADQGTRDSRALARLHEFMRAGEFVKVKDEAQRIRREQSRLAIPRNLVEEMLIQGNAYARQAAATALYSWPEESLAAELRAIATGDPGAAPFAPLSDSLAAALSKRPHNQLDLALLLGASESARLRRAGLHLAATASEPQIHMLETAVRTDDDETTRNAGMIHLLNRSEMGDEAARRAAGALAVELFESTSTRPRLRNLAIRALPFGGERGLDIGQRLLIDGGLSSRHRSNLTDGLVDAGRLPELLDHAVADRELLLELCDCVFSRRDSQLSEVMALWPYVPRVIDAPEADWADSVATSLIEVGRRDLVSELIMNESLTAGIRTDALDDLADADGDPQRALELARIILEDPDSATTLRQYTLETLDSAWKAAEALRPALLALLDKVATDDRNEWVRADAAELAERLREWAKQQR